MGIRDYRLYELDDEIFEELCSRLCLRILGEGFVNFAKGKDGGKDGKFSGKANSLPSTSGPYEGKFIVQAKHTTNGSASCSDSAFDTIIKKEKKRIGQLKNNNELEHYFLLTNRKLTGLKEPQIISTINDAVKGLSSVTIWGIERIHTFLDDNRDMHSDFKFNLPRSPLKIDPDDLELVVKGFREFIPNIPSKLKVDKGSDFLYTEIERKK